MTNLLISREKTLQLIRKFEDSGIAFVYDPEKHRLSIPGASTDETILLRLPITLPYSDGLPSSNSATQYIILLIQSGHAALGRFEHERMLDHKVFKAYMVRGKQGKSQIKYLKTRGKSKAGSRVRLANATIFFENINERLQEYFAATTIDRIAMSCSKTLIPFLYSAKVSCPFDKKDERIYKIPRHIHTPNFEVLQNTQHYLLKGELSFDQAQLPMIETLLNG